MINKSSSVGRVSNNKSSGQSGGLPTYTKDKPVPVFVLNSNHQYDANYQLPPDSSNNSQSVSHSNVQFTPDKQDLRFNKDDTAFKRNNTLDLQESSSKKPRLPPMTHSNFGFASTGLTMGNADITASDGSKAYMNMTS